MLTASLTAIEAVDSAVLCRHCGENCEADTVLTAEGAFCCRGCESVYSILKAHRLEQFYVCDVSPGLSQKKAAERDPSRFAVLDDPAIASRLVTFDDGRVARATFSIPAIHCASCVWLLEQLWRFDEGVSRAEVDLLRRAVHVDFRRASTSLRRIAEQLAALGYEPAITTEEGRLLVPPSARRLYLQLGVAGFAFGNIMLFSIPRYANGEPLEGGFQRLFDGLNLLFALPVLLFSASDYFRTAWQAVRTRTMALEVPVALGLVVLFARSVADIATSRGEGFLDSFAGLVFFLLIGRLFQQKVFERVAFDRTFRSFLPLSALVEMDGALRPLPIERLRSGDRIVMRPHEVVPADAALLDDAGEIDYAFLTGEQTPVPVRRAEIVRAGGRVVGHAIRLGVLREVSHSQLATFWTNQIFAKPKAHSLANVAARFGGWFTAGAISLALAGAVAWWPDAAASASVATAVLIIACPCALTISAPLTLGTAMGLLGTRGLYLKHPAVALDLSRVDTIAFDKTGTLTASEGELTLEHRGLSDRALALARRLAAQSVHPTSRAIAAGAARGGRSEHSAVALTALPAPRLVREVAGQGISGLVDGGRVAIGTASFITAETGTRIAGPGDVTYVAAGGEIGLVRISAAPRPGIERAAQDLSGAHDLCLLSGDHARERSRWSRLFGRRMHFRQSPHDKLAFIRDAQATGRRVLMVGDGLNDAGALAAADVGMAVANDTACMTPACDAVISGRRLADLPAFLRYARRARQVVLVCFVVSVAYNGVGLTLALTGGLTPLASAILMPVSSLTIVAISAGAMRWSARRMLPA
jgi:Cu+-exporting ATPase